MASWAEDEAVPERGNPSVGRAVAAARPRPQGPRSETAPDDRLPDPLFDRDELDDRLADERRADEGWRALPLLEDGYW